MDERQQGNPKSAADAPTRIKPPPNCGQIAPPPGMLDIDELLPRVFDLLLARYGAQGWWPADGPFEVMVGAVLTQATAWGNAARAVANLRAADALDPAALRRMDVDAVAALARPSGYYNGKARKLKALAAFIGAEFGDDIAAMRAADGGDMRRALLGVHGVGEETADAILLYALGKPAFVIDAYARRLLGRLLGGDAGAAMAKAPYGEVRRLFTDTLPPDAAMFGEYHALIVRHGKDACRKTPRCDGCPLRGVCAFGRGNG